LPSFLILLHPILQQGNKTNRPEFIGSRSFSRCSVDRGFHFCEQMMKLEQAMPVSAPFCGIFKRVAEPAAR